MGRPDFHMEARQAFDVMQSGGIALFPFDAGYAMMGISKDAVRKIHNVKGRGSHKSNAMMCDLESQRELHVLSPDKLDMIRCITLDYDYPLGVIAPYRADHPLLQHVQPDMLQTNTVEGTLGVGINFGPFADLIMDLSKNADAAVFGSSANLTGTGARYRLEDVDPTLRNAADLVADHGLCKYHYYRRSSTSINFATGEVIRAGIAYEQISDIMKRYFDWELPSVPSIDVLPSGNLRELRLGHVQALQPRKEMVDIP